ncbi:MAG: serine protease [Minwuia sp.]|nr:serine protease [Minwuia sp.]
MCLTLAFAMHLIAVDVQAARPLDLRDLSVDVQRSLMSACGIRDGRILQRHVPCLSHHSEAWRRLVFQPDLSIYPPGEQKRLREGCADMVEKGPAPWGRCIEREMVRQKVPVEYPDLAPLDAGGVDRVRDACAAAAEVSSHREAACQEHWLERVLAEQEQAAASQPAQPEATAPVNVAVAEAKAEVPSVEAQPMTGGLIGFSQLDPDSDFWPDWQGGASYRPGSATGEPLTGHELFRRVAPAVFVVLAAANEADFRAARHVRQGSAVAISEDRLATNCHTVKDAGILVLLQGKTHGPAELVHADPSSDRCILRSIELTLQPVPGVRDYADMKIGEPVFAISAPRGLQQSMQDGIVSQLRANAGVNLIQTSAYAAPGSSGGGLFDRRGNLVGITNFIVGNDDRLHFAIAADEFWK